MHRRPSILSHRPKTSSAADNATQLPQFEASMKRTASQTFHTHTHDVRDAGMPVGLGSVKEGMDLVEYPPSQHSYSSSSLSRASQVAHKIRRRFSSSSSRRPSISSALDAPMSQQKTTATTDLPHHFLQHHDSGIIPVQGESSCSSESSTSSVPHSRFSPLKRFSSFRSRRPATSGPSGDYARFNPVPAPMPAAYLSPPPGHAARASAAAANTERLQRLEQGGHGTRHANLSSLSVDGENVLKDTESGVGLICSSPVDSQEKKFDPLRRLPAEISTMIFSNLDAPSLINAELVSKNWLESASSQHVWREVFLRKYEPEVHVSPAPIMMGGAGIGKFQCGKPVPGQDWKKMYRVRMTINRRWKGCSPSAIYLNGHTDSVYCCQFDENKIITGSRDRTIRVWDMNTHKCIKVIGGPSNRPSPNTPHVLETHKEMVISHPSMNGTPEGNSIYHVPEDYHEASILCLQYDDKIMVTGSSDHTCIVWDITGPEYIPLYRLRNHTAGVLDVCLDEKHIISCSKDATINVWDRKTGNHLRKLTGHRGPVNAVQLRGHLLVSASGDGVAKLWNLNDGVCIKEFPSQDRGLAAVEFSDDAKTVLAGGNDHVVYKFDAMSGSLLHTSVRHGGLVRSLFLDAHNGRVVSGSYDQSIRIADYESGEVFSLYENWTTSWILSAKSDYRRVVATSQDGRCLILDFGWRLDGAGLLVGAGASTKG